MNKVGKIRVMILTLLFTLMGGGTVLASHDGDVLRIVFKDGQEFGYSLDEKPVVTFDGTSVLVKTSNFSMSLPETYSYNDIAKIDFVDKATSDIKQTSQTGQLMTITYLDGENVTISGLDKKAQWRLFGIDGKQYQVPSNLAGDALTISLSPLVKGVYIIRIDKYSFKIRKK